MQEYGEIYLELIREVEKAIRLLGYAQLKEEDIFIRLKAENVCDICTKAK